MQGVTARAMTGDGAGDDGGDRAGDDGVTKRAMTG